MKCYFSIHIIIARISITTYEHIFILMLYRLDSSAYWLLLPDKCLVLHLRRTYWMTVMLYNEGKNVISGYNFFFIRQWSSRRLYVSF